MARPRDAGFAVRLREAMTEARVRPVDLAKAEGVQPSSVSRWRAGEVPDDLRLPGLAKRLGVGLNWLKTGKGGKHDLGPPPGSPDEESVPAADLARVSAKLAFLLDQIATYRRLGAVADDQTLQEWERRAKGDG